VAEGCLQDNLIMDEDEQTRAQKDPENRWTAESLARWTPEQREVTSRRLARDSADYHKSGMPEIPGVNRASSTGSRRFLRPMQNAARSRVRPEAVGIVATPEAGKLLIALLQTITPKRAH
jgi:hypothetical protein